MRRMRAIPALRFGMEVIMEYNKNTKKLVTAALMAALTCIATMVIQIPTPTLGYVHPGDCFVILSGVILGPVFGPAAAGIGSMMADILTGYTIYAIPTLVIKAVSAWIAAVCFRGFRKHCPARPYLGLAVSGLLCEINVIFGYFLNKIVKVMFLAGNYNAETLASGVTSAIADLLPNTVQGTVGLILCACLFPLLLQVPDIRLHLGKKANKL